MKKISLLLIVLLVVSVLAAGCGKTDSGSSQGAAPAETSQPEDASPAEEDTQSVEEKKAGTLVMATEAGFKPYEYYEGQEIVGVDVDIAREIANEMGLELVVENMEFGSIIPAVQSGKADFGAAGISITEERAKVVDFTIEYATSKQVILTTADSGIAGEADLNGKTVGVQLGTVADLVLDEDYPEVTLQQYNKYFEAANDLLAGRINAIVLDSLPAEELAKMDDSLVILDEELFTDVYAFCVRKDNQELLDAINAVMQRLIDEGKIDAYTAAHSAD